MIRMKRIVEAGLSVVIVMLIVFAITWILGSDIVSGLIGAFGGMIGGVLGGTYTQRYQDERFGQIMNKSAGIVFVFLIITLPVAAAAIVSLEMFTLALVAGLIFMVWMSSLAIFYLSLLYYYRK
nr:MAG: hypothetical protein AM324_11210 [Candidatus Thorarchaeota archaeon SMTZ1-83]